MNISVSDITNDLLVVLEKELGDGFKTISTLATEQARQLAEYSTRIVQARTTGSLKDDDDRFRFFVKNLEEMTNNLARAVANLTILTLERAWNAIVEVIWGVINTALQGAGLTLLPVPRLSVA